jgi:hypothetical protein
MQKVVLPLADSSILFGIGMQLLQRESRRISVPKLQLLL